jgi:hypothetical protein
VFSLCQTVVLICFKTKENSNNDGSMVVDIMKHTGLEDCGETERVLQEPASMGRDGVTEVKTK